MKKIRISNRGTAITGAGVVAGVATTIHGTILQNQLNRVASLLKEAQVSRGLQLNKITKKVQSLQGPGSERVGTLEVAEIIRNLDESGILCQFSELVTVDGIVELIDVDLNNK